MSLEASIDLALLGLVLAGSVWPVLHLRPDISRAWPVLSIFGGGLCVLFATLGQRGPGWCRRGACITLAITAGALLCQTIVYWEPADLGQSGSRRFPVLTAVLAVFCLGTFQKMLRDAKGGSRLLF